MASSGREKNVEGPAGEGRLLSRPRRVEGEAPRGVQRLELGEGRDGFLYVPGGYDARSPAPLVLMLHGAGGDSAQGLSLVRDFADDAGFLTLSPDSRDYTWDVIRGGYGPDVSLIDRALEKTFSLYSVDASRVAVGGFSDGASYALSLGLTNGDLFTHVIAFSPGFMRPSERRGSPRVYVSHGRGDGVLPINSCSRRLVPQLRGAGYDVRYDEFDGPHTVPTAIARGAVEWFSEAEGATVREGGGRQKEKGKRQK